jgi:hypothetical protein
MTNNYTFGGGSKREISESFGDVLPVGDYAFTVLECGEPYQKDNGHWVLRVKLAISPGDQWVWAAPWSGETEGGEERDGIGDFLLAVNRGTTVGKKPDFQRVAGAKGRCRLKIGKNLQGQERNEVAFFHAPKQVGPVAEQPPLDYSPQEVNKAAKAAVKVAGGGDMAPDDIPF